MIRGFYILLLVLLLIALAVVLFAPSVDLEPTALRASRAAAMVFLAIFAASHFLVGAYFTPELLQCGLSEGEDPNPIMVVQPSLIDLNCTRLC